VNEYDNMELDTTTHLTPSFNLSHSFLI